MKTVNGMKPLTIFTKHFILDVSQGSKYASLTFNFFKTAIREIARVPNTC